MRFQKWVSTGRLIESAPGELWNEMGVESMPKSSFVVSTLGVTPGSSGSSNQGEQSIFAVEMPPSWKIGLILLAYVVLVVPANFLILRRFGKGEWAWITAPLLAVGFSAGFFSFSGSLYHQGRSKQTGALIVASSEAGQAYVRGQEQVFIPQGGQVDLKWDGVEAASQPTEYEYGARPSSGETLDMVEAGTLRAPRVSVPNLAFRTFEFAQVLDWKFLEPGKLTVTRISKSSVRVEGKVVNTTDRVLKDVSAVIDGHLVVIGDLEPGQAHSIKKTLVDRSAKSVFYGLLMANMTAEGLGSQIGANELGTVRLLWDIDIEVKE